MQAVKIDCTHCAQQGDCPNKTRLFINYCGAHRKKMGGNITSAVRECRSRKGRLFKRDFALRIPVKRSSGAAGRPAAGQSKG